MAAQTKQSANTIGHMRRWAAVSPSGDIVSMELNKSRIVHHLGVQQRDLRLLDPHLTTSYPSAILSRDRSLVVNLEYIKMVIGMEKCYITNLEDPNAIAFIEELRHRLASPQNHSSTTGMGSNSSSVTSLQSHGDPSVHLTPSPFILPVSTTVPPLNTPAYGTNQAPDTSAPNFPPNPRTSHPHTLGHSNGPELPFELRVLECALDVISHYLEVQAGEIEAVAHPALDALTLKVNTTKLERVRRIKTRMVRLLTHVETVKDMLEKLLEDEVYMRNIYLSYARETERTELLRRQPPWRDAGGEATTPNGANPFDVPLPPTRLAPQSSFRHSLSRTFTLGDGPEGIDDTQLDLVEQLLESYFMRVDHTQSKLQSLMEYVDDTEDFINIELDSQRNSLIRLDVMLNAVTMSVGLITAITGLFAMNVVLDPKYPDGAPYSWFVAISCASSGVSILTFVSLMVYCRWKRML